MHITSLKTKPVQYNEMPHTEAMFSAKMLNIGTEICFLFKKKVLGLQGTSPLHILVNKAHEYVWSMFWIYLKGSWCRSEKAPGWSGLVSWDGKAQKTALRQEQENKTNGTQTLVSLLRGWGEIGMLRWGQRGSMGYEDRDQEFKHNEKCQELD